MSSEFLPPVAVAKRTDFVSLLKVFKLKALTAASLIRVLVLALAGVLVGVLVVPVLFGAADFAAPFAFDAALALFSAVLLNKTF